MNAIPTVTHNMSQEAPAASPSLIEDERPQGLASDAICDILDIAGILYQLAGGNISADQEIKGTQIDLLARILKEKATAVYEIVARGSNWVAGAQA